MEKTGSKVYKNRWLILFVIVLQPFIASIDSSIINVALPVMAKKLSVTMASIEWVVTSYLIVISSTILIFGRLGDIKGKTRVFSLGIVIFTLGSLMCGISNTLPALVSSRVVQAIGAAGTMANSQGIITHLFPSHERGRALGISGTFVALGTMVGPPLGGFIVSLFSWQYIFLINVPIGVTAFLLGLKILPKFEGLSSEKLDIKGAALFSMFVILLFGSLIRGQEIGYWSLAIISGFIMAAVCMALFIGVELKLDTPLLDLKIFKNKLFSVSIFCAFVSFICIGSMNIIQPFYLQDVLKLSPGTTGMFMMVYPVILSVVAPVSGYLSDKIGSELLTFLGLVLTSAGLLFISTLNENSSLIIIVIFTAILSVGNGLFQSPNTSLVMSTVPKNKLGIAGSINALVRNLGIVFGVSLSTTLLYNRMSQVIGYRVVNYVQGRGDVFVQGMKFVYIVVAVICMIGAAFTALRLYEKRMNESKAIDNTLKEEIQ